MSGIYIPGMEMPTSCYKCHLRQRNGMDFVCPVTHERFSITDVNILEYRLDRCPLVPVPEHGRLGDLDAVVEKLKRLREYHSDDSQSGVFIAHGITQCIEVLTGKEAPTIIPADKEGEG